MGAGTEKGTRQSENDVVEHIKKVLNTKNTEMDMESLTRLCRDVNIDEVETSYNYLEFMKSKNEVHIQNLRKVINIIPVSNAECERGFSQMNLMQKSRGRA